LINSSLVKEVIQKTFNRFGLQIRKMDQGVSYVDPYVEQCRLLENHSVEVVFEVGAADGRDCLRYAELFPNSQIHAFEPVPASFAKLQKQIGALEKENRIKIVNAALSDTPGTAKFNLARWDDASSLLQANNTGSTFDEYNTMREVIEVKTETIDNYCHTAGIDRIDLLKMDAQGAELNVLKGADNVLRRFPIPLIYTEVSFLNIYDGGAPFDVLAAHLRDKGYQLHNLYGLATNQKGQLAWGDAVFVHEQLLK
jgi:FkbM family methyltransferase